jgi:hypothetical protein
VITEPEPYQDRLAKDDTAKRTGISNVVLGLTSNGRREVRGLAEQNAVRGRRLWRRQCGLL